jgi:hypothetical protein
MLCLNNFEKAPCTKASSLVIEGAKPQNSKFKKRRERRGIHAEVVRGIQKGPYKGTMPWVIYIRERKGEFAKFTELQEDHSSQSKRFDYCGQWTADCRLLILDSRYPIVQNGR